MSDTIVRVVLAVRLGVVGCPSLRHIRKAFSEWTGTSAGRNHR